ncbi:MAG: PepSY domain-containing protein [Deltaproteobacteria bacterium]|nr:PepSY domain-containing protein [Deltaproteobacteria bacterium]
MKQIRKAHLWMGTFFAPSIIFFAFTGLLQVMGMHEGEVGDAPPAWIVKLAGVHRDQRWIGEVRRRPMPAPEVAPAPSSGVATPPSALPPSPGPAEARPAPPAGPRPPRGRAPSEPLKLFFVFMSIGLMVTTGLGLYMAFVFDRNKPLLIGLVVSGTVLPVALLFLG